MIYNYINILKVMYGEGKIVKSNEEAQQGFPFTDFLWQTQLVYTPCNVHKQQTAITFENIPSCTAVIPSITYLPRIQVAETSDGLGFVEVSSSGLQSPDGLHVCVVVDSLVTCDDQWCHWALVKLVKLERLKTYIFIYYTHIYAGANKLWPTLRFPAPHDFCFGQLIHTPQAVREGEGERKLYFTWL